VIEDDGSGFAGAALSNGRGLANMRDRIESVGGTLTVGASGAGGARILATLPAEGS